MDCSTPGLPVPHHLSEFAQAHVPASGSLLVSQLFTSGGQSTGASASSPSNEYSGLISFRIDWFDLLTAQGTLKSLLQHHRNTDGPYLRRNRHGSPKRLDPEHLATVLAKIPLYSLPFVA